VVVTKAVVGGEDTALALAPRDTEKAPSSQEKAKVEKVGKVIQLDEKYSSGSWTSAPPLMGSATTWPSMGQWTMFTFQRIVRVANQEVSLL
jgi:hypothetical protein